MTLPKDAKERKATPITTGVLDYFPDAIAEIARVSKVGNDQHNPGEPLHWSREKSTDHADCITRHLLERGTLDNDGQRHSAKMAWRALALLQVEIERAREVPPKPQWVEPLRSKEDKRLSCKHSSGDDCYHVTTDGVVDAFCLSHNHVLPCAWLQPGRVMKVA